MNIGVPHIQHHIVKHERHNGHQHPPYGKRAQADNEGILQTYYIAQAQHGGTRIYLEHQFSIVGQLLSGAYHTAGKHLVPPSIGAHDKVVQTTYQASKQQRLCLATTFGTTQQHLCSGSSLGERIFAMHLAHKIFAEGNEEQYA